MIKIEEPIPSILFSGIKQEQIPSMLGCLNATVKHYKKNEFIFHSGDMISTVGMVISGSIHIIKEDYWGNRSILSKELPGDLFGEVYACIKNTPLEVSAFALEETDILALDVSKVLKVCSSACQFHTKLIENLVFILAQKNLMLTRKMEHVSKRSTREKLLSYLSSQSQQCGSNTFEIPFNRQQLADYLFVDRSAMSNELSKMQSEGLITYHKNIFTLI